MPRPRRFLPPDCVAHAVNRGNDKRLLFERTRDFEAFLDLVRWAKAKHHVEIVAYCLMGNHWHFVLWQSSEQQISRFLHLLTKTHAQSWRRRTRTVGQGHVYQDRFWSSCIFTERYYLTSIQYVEQNPLRANLVKASSDWCWSSLAERMGDDRGILDRGPVPLPIDWPMRVDETIPEEAIEEIRRSLRRR